MKTLRTAFLVFGTAAALIATAMPAQAEVNVGVSIGFPGGYGIPQPAYVPAPVYVQPQPYYVQRAPVYVERNEHGWRERNEHRDHDEGRWHHDRDDDRWNNRGWHQNGRDEGHREWRR